MNSIQLVVRGRPSAFDLSASNDLCAVASPGCITFFHLHELGSPRHVIHLEQPHLARQLKIQRHSQQLVAVLRGESVSLFDPSKSLRPLHGLIRSKGIVQCMQWSLPLPNVISTGCDAGEVTLWDCRHLAKSSLTMNYNFPIQNIEWCPTNSNLLLIEGDNQIVIWDSRMNRTPSSVLTKDREKHAFSMSFNDSVFHSAWCHDDSKPSLVISTSLPKLEWWQQTEGSSEYSVHSVMNLATPVSRSNCVLSTAVGRGLVYTQQEEGNSSSIFLQGYARAGFNLGSIFQSPDSNMSSDILTDGPKLKLATVDESIIGMKWGTPGRLVPPLHSGLELLFLTESSRLHAIKIPADSVHHHCGGLATHAVTNDPGKLSLKVPGSQVGNSLLDGKRLSAGQGGYLPNAAVTESASGEAPPNPTFPLESMKSSWFPSSNNSFYGLNPFRNMNSSESTLKKSSRDNLNGKPSSRDNLNNGVSPKELLVPDDPTGEIFWKSLQKEILTLEDQIEKGFFDGLVIGRLDQYARQITLEMHASNISIDNVTEKSIEKSKDVSYQDETISLIIYFPLKFPSLGIPTFTLRAPAHSRFSAGELPSAIINELGLIAKSASDPFSRSRNAQINNSYYSESGNNLNSNKIAGFLIDIARCFRNRVLQPFSELDGKLSINTSEINEDQNSNVDSHLLDMHSKDVANNKKYSKGLSPQKVNTESNNEGGNSGIIEPKAYRIPFPASSGATFGGNGQLICFGGAKIQNKIVGKDKSVDTLSSSGALDKDAPKQPLSYPKSYSEMLAIDRWIKETTDSLNTPKISEKSDDSNWDLSTDDTEDDSDRSDFDDDDNEGSDREKVSTPKSKKLAVHASEKPTQKSSVIEGVPSSLQHFQHLFHKYKDFLASNSFHSSPLHTSHSEDSQKSSSYDSSIQMDSLKSYMSNMSNISSPNHSMFIDEDRNGANESLNKDVGAIEDISDVMKRLSADNAFISSSPSTFVLYEIKDSDEIDVVDLYEIGLYPSLLCRKSSRCMNQLDVNRQGLNDRLARCRGYIEALKSNNTANPSAQTQSLILWWNMLSVSLEVLSLPWEGGTLISWTESSLGCSLLFELFCYLRHYRLNMTLATAICLLGGGEIVVDLIRPEITKRLKTQKSSSLSPIKGKTSMIAGLFSSPDIACFLAADLDSTEASWKFSLEYSLKIYIEFLNRQGLLVKALEASKYLTSTSLMPSSNLDQEPMQSKEVATQLFCSSCGSEDSHTSGSTLIKISDSRCNNCSRRRLYCAVCTLPVNAVNIVCIRCGHGGHPNHLASWFESSKICATGCGCKCNFNSYFHGNEESEEESDNSDSENDGLFNSSGGMKRKSKYSNSDSSSDSDASSSTNDSDDSQSNSSNSESESNSNSISSSDSSVVYAI